MLTLGQRRGDESPVSEPSGLASGARKGTAFASRSEFASSAVNVLNMPCWALLLERLGSVVMFRVLTSCALFWLLPNGALLQLSGPLPATSPPVMVNSRVSHQRTLAVAMPTHADDGADGVDVGRAQGASRKRSTSLVEPTLPQQRTTLAAKAMDAAEDDVVNATVLDGAHRLWPPSNRRHRRRSRRAAQPACEAASSAIAPHEKALCELRVPLSTGDTAFKPGAVALKRQPHDELAISQLCGGDIRPENKRLLMWRELCTATIASNPVHGSADAAVRMSELERKRRHGERSLPLSPAYAIPPSSRLLRRKQWRAKVPAEASAGLKTARVQGTVPAESEALRTLLREIVAEMPEPCPSVPRHSTRCRVPLEVKRNGSGRGCGGDGGEGSGDSGMALWGRPRRRAGRQGKSAAMRRAPQLHGASGQRLLRQLLRRRTAMSCYALVCEYFPLEPSAPPPRQPHFVVNAVSGNVPWAAQSHYQA